MMHRFVLQQNITHFEQALACCTDAVERQTITALLERARLDLAALREEEPIAGPTALHSRE